MANKVQNFVKVIGLLKNTPLPKEVLDIAKVFHNTDKMPAHQAIQSAYNIMDTPIPSVHKYAIDELAKGHKWGNNYEYYKTPMRVDAPAQPLGYIEVPRNSSSKLEQVSTDFNTTELPTLRYVNSMLKSNNNLTKAGEPMVSDSFADELKRTVAVNGRNSEFIRLINALGLGW